MEPPVDNQTDFAVHPQVLVDRDGEKLCAMVKATLELLPGDRTRCAYGVFSAAPDVRKRGLRLADVPWGKPEISSIRYPSDLCLRKPGTDIIVVATGHAPGGRPVEQFDVGIRVGKLSKVVRVMGLRVWEADGEGISAPRPLAALDLRYDYAWGGVDDSDLMHFIEEPRNPVGRGVARDRSKLTHRPAPQIEDPQNLIGSVRTKPEPAGLGAIGRHWEPRRSLWGTYDDAWLENKAPLLPDDFDDRANHAASSGLVASPPLRGGEEAALTGLLYGGGVTTFTMPTINLEISFERNGTQLFAALPHVDTMLFDAMPIASVTVPGSPLLTLEYVWRASIPAPRKADDITVVVRERTR